MLKHDTPPHPTTARPSEAPNAADPSLADAASMAAEQLDLNTLQAQAASQVADQVESIAQKLRTSDLSTVTKDVSDFARKNPALFIGGAALLGLAAARFLKARDPQRIEPAPTVADTATDPWADTAGGPNVPS